MKRLLPILILQLLSISAFANVPRSTPDLPFQPGERLTYQIKWGVIPAGEVIFEVHPGTNDDGTVSYEFLMTVNTNRFADKFYKVRDRIQAVADAAMTHSLFYGKKQEEGDHRRDVSIAFDWESNTARYSNHGKHKEPIRIDPGTFDPLTFLYKFRTYDIDEHRRYSIPVTDGKQFANGLITTKGKQWTATKAGRYATILVEPDLKHVRGVFKKSKDAQLRIWFTDDEYKIPVKFRSRVLVGSFTGELVSIDRIM